MKLKRLFTLAILAAVFFISTNSEAAMNSFTYQGKVADSVGAAVTGDLAMTFTIYDDPSAGTLLSTNIFGAVAVANGIFTVTLTNLGSVDFTAGTYYLNVNIEGTDLTPRQELHGTPTSFYAMDAGNADNALVSVTANGAYYADTAANADLATNSISLGGTISTDWATDLELDAEIATVVAAISVIDTTLSGADVIAHVTAGLINLALGSQLNGFDIINSATATVDTTISSADVEAAVNASTALDINAGSLIGGVQIASTSDIVLDTTLSSADVEAAVNASTALDINAGSLIGGVQIASTSDIYADADAVAAVTAGAINLATGSKVNNVNIATTGDLGSYSLTTHNHDSSYAPSTAIAATAISASTANLGGAATTLDDELNALKTDYNTLVTCIAGAATVGAIQTCATAAGL